MNRIITDNEDPKIEKADTSKLSDTVKKVADFDFNISREILLKQLPFALFICFLLVLLIWNGHTTEKLIRSIDKVNKENKELRSEYTSIMSEMMNQSRQSSIAKRLENVGIKESKNPPQKITINGN
ncbi:MAG: FtsL-like putative cell division protein [Bacteroidetes bacterium]|nr:FtsL-like putative cell division protein [Bacteroidota bacterium]